MKNSTIYPENVMQIMLCAATRILLVLVASAGWMITAHAHAAAPSCDAVYEAGIK
jgi:hypothetical protein